MFLLYKNAINEEDDERQEDFEFKEKNLYFVHKVVVDLQ